MFAACQSCPHFREGKLQRELIAISKIMLWIPAFAGMTVVATIDFRKSNAIRGLFAS
jgi:hypothetical protein